MATVQAYTESGKVAVRAPDGEVGLVPQAKLSGAMSSGFAPLTPEQFAEAKRQKELDNPALAIAAGAARGLTLGLSDVALTESGLVDPSTLQGFEEVNPGSSIASEIVGNVASALIPGGALGLAGKAAAKGGAALAARAGTGLAGRLAAKAAPVAAQATAEGALVGGGQAVSDIALAPPGAVPSVGKEIAQRALTGAAISGITGLGMLGAGAAIGGTARKLGQLGKRPTQQAKAARSLLDAAETHGTQSTGIARAGEIEMDLADIAKVRQAIKQKISNKTVTPAEAEAYAQAGAVQKTLNAERSAIQRELQGLPKPGGATKSTTTKTTWRGRRQKELDIIGQKVGRGEILTAEERLIAMEPNMARLTGLNDELNAAIDQMRNQQRALYKATGAIDDDVNRVAAKLWQEREIVRRQLKNQQAMVQRVEQARAFSHGTDINRAIGAELTDATADTVTRTERVIERAATKKQAVKLPADALAELAEQQTPLLQQIAQGQTSGEFARLANWRSASVLMGAVIGDAPGALLGAIVGFAGVQRFMGRLATGTLEGVGAGARIAAKAAGGARVGTTSTLLQTAQDIADFSEAARSPQQDPDLKYQASYEGYIEAGLPSMAAQSLAAMQAGKILAVRAALPSNPRDPVQRQHLRYTVDATENPRSIVDRIGKDATRKEDAEVLDYLAPEVASAVASIAERVLQESDSLPPAKRRSLQHLAGQSERARRETLQLQQLAFGDDSERQPSHRLAPNMPSMATSVQSAATSLGA